MSFFSKRLSGKEMARGGPRKDMSPYYRYVAFRHKQSGKILPIYANTVDKISRIGNRGLARDSWAIMLSWLGRSAAAKNATTSKEARKHIEVQKQLAGTNPHVRLTNFLTYIEKIAPGIVDMSLDAAAKRMEYLIDKRIAKAVA